MDGGRCGVADRRYSVSHLSDCVKPACNSSAARRGHSTGSTRVILHFCAMRRSQSWPSFSRFVNALARCQPQRDMSL